MSKVRVFALLFSSILVLTAQAPLATLGLRILGVDVLRVETPSSPIEQPIFVIQNRVTSPNNRYVLFVATDAQGHPSVWLEHGTSRVLVREGGDYPLFAPNGEWFGLIAPRKAEKSQYPRSLFIYSVQPLRLVRQIEFDPFDYRWSPSGDRVAITGRLGAVDRQPAAVVIAEIVTGIKRTVDRIQWYEDPHSGQWWVAEVPGFSWSPDGRFLAYSRVDRTVYDGSIIDSDLYVAKADGSTRQCLTNTPLVAELWPRWVKRDGVIVYRDHWRRASGPNPFQWIRTDEVQLRLAVPGAILNSPTLFHDAMCCLPR